MGTYIGGRYVVVAVIPSQTGWLYIFKCGRYAGAMPHDEEGVET